MGWKGESAKNFATQNSSKNLMKGGVHNHWVSGYSLFNFGNFSLLFVFNNKNYPPQDPYTYFKFTCNLAQLNLSGCTDRQVLLNHLLTYRQDLITWESHDSVEVNLKDDNYCIVLTWSVSTSSYTFLLVSIVSFPPRG